MSPLWAADAWSDLVLPLTACAADSSDAWLQKLMKEEDEEKAKAAAALERKRAKRQVGARVATGF